MKRIKKVSVTPLSDTAGSIIDSLYSGSNEVTNAPSIRAVKAALGQTFYATTASGSGSSYRYYTITDASLPAEPVNGMTIKVTFPVSHSGYFVYLRLNSGNYRQCFTQDVTGIPGSGPYPGVTTNRVYELVYCNGSWYFLSAFQKIKSDNIDWGTVFGNNVIIIEDGTSSIPAYFRGTYSVDVTIPVGGSWLLIDCWSGVFQRVSNSINSLRLMVDNVERIVYTYPSTSSDNEWGATRRTLSGTNRKLSLAAGAHKITTSGNLYADSVYGPSFHQIILMRIG